MTWHASGQGPAPVLTLAPPARTLTLLRPPRRMAARPHARTAHLRTRAARTRVPQRRGSRCVIQSLPDNGSPTMVLRLASRAPCTAYHHTKRHSRPVHAATRPDPPPPVTITPQPSLAHPSGSRRRAPLRGLPLSSGPPPPPSSAAHDPPRTSGARHAGSSRPRPTARPLSPPAPHAPTHRLPPVHPTRCCSPTWNTASQAPGAGRTRLALTQRHTHATPATRLPGRGSLCEPTSRPARHTAPTATPPPTPLGIRPDPPGYVPEDRLVARHSPSDTTQARARPLVRDRLVRPAPARSPPGVTRMPSLPGPSTVTL
jgi:hypothetical protein